MTDDLLEKEIVTLFMISDGRNIKEISEWRGIPLSILEILIQRIMQKTQTNTWKELKDFSRKFKQEQISKEHMDKFCEMYHNSIIEHKKLCKICKDLDNGTHIVCPIQEDLSEKKQNWMSKLYKLVCIERELNNSRIVMSGNGGTKNEFYF